MSAPLVLKTLQQPAEEEIEHSRSVIAVTICSLFLVLEITAGLLGDTMICVIVYKSKTLRTSVNALLVNLAIADIATTVSTAPILLTTVHVKPAFNGTVFLYPGYSYLLAAAVHISHIICGTVQLVTLVAIGYERYQAIAKPFEKAQRARRVKINIVVSWLLGLVNCFIAVGGFHGDLELEQFRAPPLTMTLYSNYISYVFIPFSFIAILLILIIYAMILYMVKRHVQGSSKLFKKKSIKVAPKQDKPSPEESSRSDKKTSNVTDISRVHKNSPTSSKKKEDNKPVFTIEPKSANAGVPNGSMTHADSSNDSDINDDLLESIRKLHLVPLRWRGNVEKLKLLRQSDIGDKIPIMSGSAADSQKGGPSMVHRRSTGFLPRRQTSMPETEDDSKPSPDKTLSRRTSYHYGVNIAFQTDYNFTRTARHVKSHSTQTGDDADKANASGTKTIQTNKKLVEGKPLTPLRSMSETKEDSCLTGDSSQVTNETGGRSAGKELKTDTRLPAIVVSEQRPKNTIQSSNGLIEEQIVKKSKSPDNCPPDSTANPLLTDSKTTQLLLQPHPPTQQPAAETMSSVVNKTSNAEPAATNIPRAGKPSGDLTGSQGGGGDLGDGVVEVCDMDGGKVKVVVTQSEVVGSICVMNNANKERGKRRVEAKTAKASAIVISAFLVSWLPFLVVVVVARASGGHVTNDFVSTAIDEWFAVALSLAVLGAAINPIAYGVSNKQFRNELSKIYRSLKKRWKNRKANT